MPQDFSAVQKARAGFIFALICLGVVGIISYLSVNRLSDNADLARHTEEVISSLRLVLSQITDAETGQRGYAIVGEEQYLEPYLAARQSIGANLASLRSLTSDNPSQQRRLSVLEPLVELRMNRLAAVIERRRKEGFEAARVDLATGGGKELHDQIRGVLAEMETTEQVLSKKQRDRARQSGEIAEAIIIGGSLLALSLVALASRTIGKDITRRRAQIGRAALAGRLSRMGAWEVELPDYKQTWSDEVCAIYEVPPGTVLPVEQAINRYAPEFHESITDAFQACARDGTPYDLELQILTTNGRRVWVRTIGEAERNTAGVIRRVHGALQDISARKEAEEEARELAGRLTTTLESLTDGFFTLDLNWCFTYVNGEAARMLKRSREELLGNNIWTMFPEARDTVSHQEYERALRDNVAVQFESFSLPLEAWFDARAFPSPQGLAVYFHDITEKKAAEKKQRETEESFRAMANNISQLAWMADASGNIFWYNDRWFDYSGTTLEEMAGWGWQKIHHPDHVERVTEKIARCFKNAEIWEDTFPLRGRDGVYRWFLSRAVPIRDPEGKVLRWFGTNTDVTSIKSLEEELAIARDQAIESARLKSEFLANMSHEIRTPMNGIIGMTDLALDTKLDRAQREYLGMVKTSAHALLSLINDILDFSKIEAGKLELEAIDFSLRDCIGDALKPLGIRADQKGIELVADIAADVPDHLIGDSMRLRQILLNLTDNAIKFTQQGEVIVKVINLAPANGESLLQFSITDTGIGIPAEKQAAIFEAFAQVDGSTTRTYGGTGLGLSIASELVQKMRGRIWIESKPGLGTTFFFTTCLPVGATPTRGDRHAVSQPLGGLRVLVADDNAVNRRILHEMLSNWHMQPTVVESGAAALDEMLRAARTQTPFALVVLDGMMPSMDGFTVVERIRENPELSAAAIMMLSSSMPTGAAVRCRELEVASYLTKPVTQSDMLDAILVALGGAEDATVSKQEQSSPTRNGPLTASRRILLAEDNAINRAVASGFLEKEGHVLVHAVNGRKAVEACEAGAFDLIFMDVQMPEMDGFEATGLIRKMEAATGMHTPIIALTSHAMTGDRERCLAAGMDGYVAKPVSKEELLGAIAEFAVKVERPATSVPPTERMYGAEELLRRLGGDPKLVERVIALFRENVPQVMATLRQALNARDTQAMATAAHRLIGSFGVVGAVTAASLARDLEVAAEGIDTSSAASLIAELEDEGHTILAGLASIAEATCAVA